MSSPRTDFARVLKILVEHGVDFVVVGGVSAVLQGAPVTTFDLDLVHSRDPENAERLLLALDQLDAHYRGRPGPKRRPELSHLESPGHQLLLTRFGPLDLLGAIGKNRGYEELVPHSVTMSLGKHLKVHVLNLATLIATKEEAGRDKDRAMLPVLRGTLAERERQRPPKE